MNFKTYWHNVVGTLTPKAVVLGYNTRGDNWEDWLWKQEKAWLHGGNMSANLHHRCMAARILETTYRTL